MFLYESLPIFISCLLIYLQTPKNEEEEFNTGPLSVLMMSVKNNTQVISPSSVRPCNTRKYALSRAEINVMETGSYQLSQQQKASRPSESIRSPLQHGSGKCQGNVDWGCFSFLLLFAFILVQSNTEVKSILYFGIGAKDRERQEKGATS